MPIFDKIAKNSILRICKPLKLPQHHHVNGYAWNKKRNDRQAKAHWQFTTADARVKLIRLYPTLSM
jgi:hypothetical protein